MDTRNRVDRKARLEALKFAWDGQGFRCYYGGVRLIEDSPGDPRYITYDHRTPRDERDVVLCAGLIMKSDMSEAEFRNMVVQLASRFTGGKFDESVFGLKHWKR